MFRYSSHQTRCDSESCGRFLGYDEKKTKAENLATPKTTALKKLEQELERAATALSMEPTAEVSRSQQADERESSRSAVVSAIAECRDEGQLDAAIQQLDSAARQLLCQDERVIGWESFLAEVKHAALLLADNEANPDRPRFLSSRGVLLLIFVGVAALAVGGWFLTSDRQMFAKGMCYSGDRWTQGDIVEIPCANVGVADFEVIGTGDISRLAVGTPECPEGPGVFVSRTDEQAVCLRSGLATRSDSGGFATTSVESTEVTNVEHTVVVCTNEDDVALERATQAVKALPGTLKVSRVYQLSGPSIHVDVVGNPSDDDVEWLCVGSFVTIRSLLVGPFPAEMEESYLEHVHSSVDAEAVVVRSASAESYVVSGASDGAVIEFESFEVHLETELEGDLNIVLSEVEHARIVEATRDCVDRAPVCPDGKVAFLVGGVLISAPIIFGELPPEFVLSDSLTDVELGEFVELVEGAVGLGSVEQIERSGS